MAAAFDYVKACGVDDVAVIGHRVGALLACSGERVLDSASALVLWDPVVRGRAFVRAKQVMYNVISQGPEDTHPDIHLLGLSLNPVAAQELSQRKIDPTRLRSHADNVLLVVEPDDRSSTFVDEAASAGCDVIDVPGQPAFREPTDANRKDLPFDAVDAICAWLDSKLPVARRAVTFTPNMSAIFGRTASGTPVETTVIVLPRGDVIWDTRPVGSNPAAVFVAHSLGRQSRFGPARLWREAGDAVAARGGRAIRYDRVGVAEAGPVTRKDELIEIFSSDYLDDGMQVLEKISFDDGAHVLHAGICLGAWMSANAAMRSEVDSSVILICPLRWKLRSHGIVERALLSAEARSDRARKVVGKVHMLAIHVSALLSRFLPNWLFAQVTRVPLIEDPAMMLLSLHNRGVATRVVLSPGDTEVFQKQAGEQGIARRTGREAASFVRNVDTGDHTAFHRVMREVVIAETLSALGMTSDASADSDVVA